MDSAAMRIQSHYRAYKIRKQNNEIDLESDKIKINKIMTSYMSMKKA